LESCQLNDLATVFLTEYEKHFQIRQTSEDDLLFIYFKALRANIRAKVHVLSAQQARTNEDASIHVKEARKYLFLMDRYMMHLQAVARTG